MAELVCLAEPRPGHDLGDIIHVRPDGHAHGDNTALDLVVVVCVPGMSLSEAEALCVGWEQFDPVMLEWQLVAPRRYRVDLNAALDYDQLAHLYCVDWEVPVIDPSYIKDKTNGQ